MDAGGLKLNDVLCVEVRDWPLEDVVVPDGAGLLDKVAITAELCRIKSRECGKTGTG